MYPPSSGVIVAEITSPFSSKEISNNPPTPFPDVEVGDIFDSELSAVPPVEAVVTSVSTITTPCI